jgi:hypothetical protein
MTLVISLITANAIYQSADHRLSDGVTGRVLRDNSTKVVVLQYSDWDGFLTYTGIGSYYDRDTSEFALEWLAGTHDAKPADVVSRLQERGRTWLQQVERSSRRQWKHTFVLAAFEDRVPQISLISNCEDVSGRQDVNGSSTLRVTTKRFGGEPFMVACGSGAPSITREQRRRLVHLGKHTPDDGPRFRQRLREINREVAGRPASRETVSQSCSAFSMRADGRGFEDSLGEVHTRVLANGQPFPDLSKVFGRTMSPVGASFASTKGRVSHEPCRFTVQKTSPAYTINEIAIESFESACAMDVNEEGTIVGRASPIGNPAVTLTWTADATAAVGLIMEPKITGQPHAIGRNAVVVGGCETDDHRTVALRRAGNQYLLLGDLGCAHSEARGINADGVAGGWVSFDPSSRGQTAWRPCIWKDGKLVVIENCPCAWGYVVDINDAGLALVCAYSEGPRNPAAPTPGPLIAGSLTFPVEVVAELQRIASQICHTILWNTLTGHLEDYPGIIPHGVNAAGTVLGTAQVGSDRVPVTRLLGGVWTRVVIDAALCPSAMNDVGDIVGHGTDDSRPWLRRANGELVWLPRVAHHRCVPLAINNTGVIVGSAAGDHGSHAVVWSPSTP